MQDEPGHACSHVQLVSAYSRMVIMSSFSRQAAEAMQKANFIGVPVDVRRGAWVDLSSPAGMALAVLLLLSVRAASSEAARPAAPSCGSAGDQQAGPKLSWKETGPGAQLHLQTS